MGRAVAIELASKGANVVVVARTISKLEATVEDMKVCVPFPTVFLSFILLICLLV